MFNVNRKFLQAVCDVPEPEERFNMDEYSEMVILNKPVVYISISELLNTHKVRILNFNNNNYDVCTGICILCIFIYLFIFII